MSGCEYKSLIPGTTDFLNSFLPPGTNPSSGLVSGIVEEREFFSCQ
jgi:hypothetical protein